MTTDPANDPSSETPNARDNPPTRPPETVTTYQQSLDEALEETFPASDPISPSALQALEDRMSTGADSVDWPLRSHGPVDPMPASWAAALGAFGAVLFSAGASRPALVVRAAAGALLAVGCLRAWARRRRD